MKGGDLLKAVFKLNIFIGVFHFNDSCFLTIALFLQIETKKHILVHFSVRRHQRGHKGQQTGVRNVGKDTAVSKICKTTEGVRTKTLYSAIF